jgi:hypothetical protein
MAYQTVADRGLFAHGFAMLGFPTETDADVKATLQVACNSRLHTAAFLTVIPYPGKELPVYVAQDAPDKLKGLVLVGGGLHQEPDQSVGAGRRGAVRLSASGLAPVLPESRPPGAHCARLSESMISPILYAYVFASCHRGTFR